MNWITEAREANQGAVKREWRCYFCDEVFTTVGAAADHFGHAQHSEPGCLIDFRVATEEGGKPERGRGLLMALRKAEAELTRYREEDTDLHRALHAKDCERNTAVMRAEEQGYARGLRDGVNLPADSPERAAIAGVPASAPEPCPRGADRPEPSCTNRHQCWEPCGELGHSAEHARIAGVLPLEVPSQHTDPSKWPSKADIDRADPRCKGCDLPNGHPEYCRCTPRVQEVPHG